MFGIFKKKEAAPMPDPASQKAAERIKEQTEIAELQSQIAELRRKSVQMNAEIARKTEERAGLMAKIRDVPPAQKTALALRVKNIDKVVSGLNANLALVEQQIGNNEAVILQMTATGTVDVGNVENVVDIEKHKEKIQGATEKKQAGDINVGIADEMVADLTGDPSAISSDVADILAEAEGAAPSVSPNTPSQSSEPVRPGHPKSAGQF